MYDIGISEIRCTARYEDADGVSIKYDAEASKRPNVCSNPECDRHGLHAHSSSQNLIKDTRAEGKLVFINLKVQKYRCPTCGKITPDRFTFYDKHSHITHRLRKEFIRRCINGETFSHIAKDYGVDHKTVSAAFREYEDTHRKEVDLSYTPEVLGIDEAHIADQYRLVLTDIKKQKLLDIKKDNSSPMIKGFLKTLDGTICKCATMDFAPAYARAVSEILPDTAIVIDKFHVVQEVNRCLDNVRKSIQNDLRANGVSIRRFKKSRLLFMTNWEDLKESSIPILQSWFTEFPNMYEAYMCKETFRDIYLTAETYEEAAIMFDAWIDAIPDFEQFQPMRKTMRSRRDHILNYWHYKWTNTYTESVNNIIKELDKAGRGYGFETLRGLCILRVNKSKMKRFDPRNAEYIPADEKIAQSVLEDAKKDLYYMADQKDGNRKEESPSLKKHVVLYLEINSVEQHKENFEKRMRTYYDKLSSII